LISLGCPSTSYLSGHDRPGCRCTLNEILVHEARRALVWAVVTTHTFVPWSAEGWCQKTTLITRPRSSVALVQHTEVAQLASRSLLCDQFSFGKSLDLRSLLQGFCSLSLFSQHVNSLLRTVRWTSMWRMWKWSSLIFSIRLEPCSIPEVE
jgi:hypothetical protein